MYDFLLSAFTTLFVIIDPIGLAPIFMAVTTGLSADEQRTVAIRASVTATLILVAFALGGAQVLAFLGISIPAFRIAGGLLMFWIAFEMVFEKRQERKVQSAEKAIIDIHGMAVFPLAIPLISGPGAISATVVIASQAPSLLAYLALFAIILAIMAMTLAAFLAARPIDRALGPTGRAVITRLFGVLLAALSVQIVADGARGLLALPIAQ